jgi:glycosyltransferase involved in cell wall biosynthesis
MKLNITPNPIDCAGVPGGVNSVVYDHAVGFLAEGCEIGTDGDVNIVHAVAQQENIDVFHCHGLYPIGPGYFSNQYQKANDILLQNALKAQITICISEFSANILRHKLHIDPIVTRNGIWVKDYAKAGSSDGPVLFPKASLDANAKPNDMLWLKNNTDFKLLSIAQIPGIDSTGKLGREKFLQVLSGCSVYLGTTKENNSMASMEAMVSGVPVVGYDIGFNREWLTNGIGCELVPFGDTLALKDALLKVQADWQRYSKQARAFAQIFDWQPVIKQLVEIYQNINKQPDKTVSIVIPCHNYGQYLGQAIESAMNQTVPCEVIVVDDLSTDDSLTVAERYPVHVIRNQNNVGVAETRNIGIEAASGNYIICLDADDYLDKDFARRHLDAFRTNQDAVAYAPIRLVDEQGRPRNQVLFSQPAQPGYQAIGRNQVPSCCMFRKEFWRRAGGYDRRYSPAEDAQFWLKIFSLGGQAVRVSAQPMMSYRIHGNSLSAKGFPDWWGDSAPAYSEPIQERDSDITVFIEDQENAKEILWLLEKSKYKRWNCQMENPGNLSKTFPWLNRQSPSKNESQLHLKAMPSSTCLEDFTSQTPSWITGSSGQLP